MDDYRFASEQDINAGHVTIDSFSQRDADLLAPAEKAVFTQYVKDRDDHFLIDGYFRETIPNQNLPEEVNRMIAAYYLKTYSISNLHEKIISLRMIPFSLYSDFYSMISILNTECCSFCVLNAVKIRSEEREQEQEI